MSKITGKKWRIYLIVLSFITTKAIAQIVEPPNTYDEYEVIDTQLSHDLNFEDWNMSLENVRGVEFQNLELNTNPLKVKSLKNEEVYKGRVFLNDRKGVIYSIVDPIGVSPRLNILTDKYIQVDSLGKVKKPILFYPYTNYEKNIKKYEVIIYKESDTLKRSPIVVISGDKIDYNTPIVWDG